MKQGSGRAVFGVPFLAILLLAALVSRPVLPKPALAKVRQVMQVNPTEVWKGTVAFTEVALAEKSEDNSNGEKIDVENFRHSINSTVTIHACGPLKELHASSIDKNRGETENYHRNEKVPVGGCAGDDPDAEYSGRFNQETEDRNLTYRFYDTLPPSDQKKYKGGPPARIVVAVMPTGHYTIVVDAALYTVMEGQSTLTKSRGCENASETHTKTYKLAPFGTDLQPTSTVTEQGSMETLFTPPMLHWPTAGWMGQGEWTPKGFGSQQMLIDQKAERPGEMGRSLQVTWQFEPKGDACRDAYDLLYQDLAWAEAYANPDLADRAGDLRGFKELVGEQAFQNYKGYLPPDMMGASVAMSVDPADCGLHGFDDAEERVDRHCLPKVIYEAVLTHELEHVRQCQTQGEAFKDTGNFRAFARFEVEAHLKGINHLKSYVEDHCQEAGNLYNMYDVENRIAQLEAWLGR